MDPDLMKNRHNVYKTVITSLCRAAYGINLLQTSALAATAAEDQWDKRTDTLLLHGP